MIVNYLFSDNRFNTPEIYYDIEESVLNSSKSEGVIARDVYGIYEIANKIFYITSYGYGIYIENFAQYNQLYGSIGALLIFLLYIWLNATIILLGFELNASVLDLKNSNECSL